MQSLKINSTLQGGKYKIIAMLGQGGFGITYLAENTMLDGKVAIKEFFFKEYCNRDEETSHVTIPTDGNREIVERFKAKFIKEARTIFKLNHPNIVRIFDIFEENGTAYYVMDYVDGENLSVRLKRTNAPLAESEVRNYLNQILDGLEAIHNEGMFHLDIKPANIMVDSHDVVKLIDFGASKQQSTVGGATMSTVSVIRMAMLLVSRWRRAMISSVHGQTTMPLVPLCISYLPIKTHHQFLTFLKTRQRTSILPSQCLMSLRK